jgi:transcriptional antiterminator NusG
MEKKWYVVHTYSGYEHKAKAALEERVKAMGKTEEFGEVLVPAEKVVELVKGRKKTSSRKFFPGYILVNMALNDETWHVVKSTPKVTGFVGDARNPSPISENEVRDITQQMAEGAARPKPKVQFEAGESVKVIDGPFQDFNGVVEDVKAEKGKLRVLISIFGRATPVELDFVQVERA